MNDHPRIPRGGHFVTRNGIRRRDFVAGTLAAGAAAFAGPRAWAQGGATVPLHCVPPLPPGEPVNFVPPTSSARIRKSAFELDAGEIARLKKAYAALRDLTQQKPDDPRGWFHQGQVHCWYCSGAVDGLNGQEIHGGWWFLPWHRAYLFFHEQILGSLIGDPTFALPYWDWDTPGRNKFPFDAYGQPGDTGNPLYDPTRGVGPTDTIPLNFVGPGMMKYVLGSATFADFGGSSDQSLGQGQMGHLEGGPHGGVHVWTTDPTVDFDNPKPDMGVLASAAFDPVFFAHHANIDRIWDKWIKTDPTHHANPANPADTAWLQQGFFFYDQKPTWTYISNSQMLEPEALLYSYQSPQTPVAPVTPGPVASARAAVRVAQLPQLGAPEIELSPSTEPKALTPEPLTVRAAVPPQARERLNTFRATAAARPGAQPKLILRIEGVEIPADRGALVNVFLNRPEATAASGPEDPGYVGSIAVVASQLPRAGGHTHPVVRNFSFDISDKLAASLANDGNVAVTLVPATGTGTKPAAVSLRYSRAYIATRQ
jgi:polyphenol oxidase